MFDVCSHYGTMCKVVYEICSYIEVSASKVTQFEHVICAANGNATAATGYSSG